MKHFAEILSLSAEFRKFPVRGEDDACLKALMKKMIEEETMSKKPCHKAREAKFFERWPACHKVNILLHAHLNRKTSDQDMTVNLQADLMLILDQAPRLLDAMFDIALSTRNYLVMQGVLRFRQHLTQVLYFSFFSFFFFLFLNRGTFFVCTFLCWS